MKKILNAAEAYVDEDAGWLHGGESRILPPATARAAASWPAPGPGARARSDVTGGGSGHLPVFTGYVGEGLLDACAIGDVFASPSAEADGLRDPAPPTVARGVLRLYGNYGGDVMNFDMAGDLVEFDDITCTTVSSWPMTWPPRAPEEKEKAPGRGGAWSYALQGSAGAAAEGEKAADLDGPVHRRRAEGPPMPAGPSA